MASVADHHGPVRRGVQRVGLAMRSAVGAVAGWPIWPALHQAYRRIIKSFVRILPKGLFARSLIIIIAPIVLLQAAIAFIFLERHYTLVTQSLAASTARDIAAFIEMLEAFPGEEATDDLIRIAGAEQDLIVAILPGVTLPPGTPQPFFSLLDRTLSQEIADTIGLPYWIDTVGTSNLIEIRIQLDGRVLQVLAQRSEVYATSSEIFILWMIGTSLVLLTIAILFLRNQIKPIQRLADAAERFGRGRPAPDFAPRGAREVRRASAAFIRMRERIIRQIEQRTEMLAGVSHDLRTILTRFRLQLELMDDGEGSDELRKDIADMQQMLEDYLAFASGDSTERNEETDIAAMLEREAQHLPADKKVSVDYSGDPVFTLRPIAFRRAVANLISNAARHADRIAVSGSNAVGWLTVTIDDNGAGIPEAEREAVFKPFRRLDAARNIEDSGTGLGLPIARDIARAHGGDVTLSESPLGGLRATIRIPG